MPNDKQKLNKLMVHSLDKVSPWGRNESASLND